jgi:hypothetical protein
VGQLKTALRRLLPWQLQNLRFGFGAPLSYQLGHFYSPVCDPAEVGRYYRDPANHEPPASLPGIALDGETLVRRWGRWAGYLADWQRQAAPTTPRYRRDNTSFHFGEAAVLHAVLRELRPKRLVEIGCGMSSACALDTIEGYLDNAVDCTFIDPYPQYLRTLLKPGDEARITVLGQPVQTVDMAVFEALEAGDVLFIDTSHVMKTGSDVVFELFEILPRLKSGVHIHFHDIHYPFEYPRRWVEELNYSWNEIYAVRAFLTHNSAFEIVFFNDYFQRMHRSILAASHPGLIGWMGSGLWLRRT